MFVSSNINIRLNQTADKELILQTLFRRYIIDHALICIITTQIKGNNFD